MFGLVDTCGYCSDLTLGPAVETYLAASHPNLQNILVLIDSIAYPQNLPDSVDVLATPILGPLLIYTIPNTIQAKSLLKKVYFNTTVPLTFKVETSKYKRGDTGYANHLAIKPSSRVFQIN